MVDYIRRCQVCRVHICTCRTVCLSHATRRTMHGALQTMLHGSVPYTCTRRHGPDPTCCSKILRDSPPLIVRLVSSVERTRDLALQTYEGGLGGEPGNEAHGGYTYCGLAALCLLGNESVLDLPALLHWAAQRQGSMEGGFNGRTNKLVDGCYSFWQGSLFTIMQRLPETALHCPRAAVSTVQPCLAHAHN